MAEEKPILPLLDGRITFSCPSCGKKAMVYATELMGDETRVRRYICQHCSTITLTGESIIQVQESLI